LSLCLFASQFASIAHARPGFSKIDNSSLPQAVVTASKSVFKIISQAGRINRIVHLDDKAVVEAAQNDFSAKDRWWQKMQLEFCKRTLDKVCPILDQMGDGSAFLLNGENQLYSNLHNFTEVLSALASQTPDLDRSKLRLGLLGTNLFFGLTDGTQPIFDPGLRRIEHCR
jgi:hypothetical protein